MKLIEHQNIMNAFGENAKWIESNSGLKGMIFMSATSKLHRYDEIHLGKFISSGNYAKIFKEVVNLLPSKRIIFIVEYSILKVALIRKSKQDIKILNMFTIGLFYGRDVEVLLTSARKSIATQTDINISISSVRHFFENFKGEEIHETQLNSSMSLFEEMSGVEFSKREKYFISKHAIKISKNT